ncbi:MAG: hypothetical protein HYZ57_17335, partial [Acidobacteria bacterium]|nr:hypothetical protein [Acidobacteriota bacterium]
HGSALLAVSQPVTPGRLLEESLVRETRRTSISLSAISLSAAALVLQTTGLATSWSPDGRGIFFHDVPGRVSFLDLASHRSTLLLAKPDYRLVGTEVSPGGRWIAFSALSAGSSRVFIAPFRAPAAIGEKDWIPMTDGRFWDLPARWAPGGDVIYFLSNRDGYSCIWAQRLDALTKHASGPPVGLYHAHSASQTMAGFSLARDRIVFNMAERTGNIWMAEWKAQ